MTVRVNGLRQGYGTAVAIKQLTVTFEPGITALLGPNGAGKTTLLRTLATIFPPKLGTVDIDGTLIHDEKTARRARSQIGYLPQDFGVDPGMTVSDFVEYAAWIRGIDGKRRREAVDHALAMVDLSDRRSLKMRKLSGGMRRRAGIAWAIVGRPRLILLDEPTVGLDPRQRLQFRKIVSSLDDSVVILSTHLIDDVEAICDQVLVLHDGEARFSGSVADMASLGRVDLPGHSHLERAYMHLLPAGDQQL